MNRSQTDQPDPRLDLVLERVVDVPPALVWKAWTEPEQLKKWFTPAPWVTTECEVDLRPGGIFRFAMRPPEGEEHRGASCYLEIVENEKLVWTNALEPGYRPAPQKAESGDCTDFVFTAVIKLELHGKGTKYTAIAIHRNEAERKKHEEMGFHEGWGKCLDQLVALAKTW